MTLEWAACAQCCGLFAFIPRSNVRNRFCSEKCCNNHYQKEKNARDKNGVQLPLLRKKCKHCGKSFITILRNQVMCSTKCTQNTKNKKRRQSEAAKERDRRETASRREYYLLNDPEGYRKIANETNKRYRDRRKTTT